MGQESIKPGAMYMAIDPQYWYGPADWRLPFVILESHIEERDNRVYKILIGERVISSVVIPYDQVYEVEL